MNKIHFTVGPSELYPTVPRHIANAVKIGIPSLSHRSEGFKKMNQSTQENLRKLLTIPDTHHIFYTGSALEAMERVIQNTVEKHVLHFVNGSFSREFYQTAVDLRKKPQRIDSPNGQGFDFKKIKIPKKVETVCFVHNETSTGVALDMEGIYELKSRYPDKIFAIDLVSSAPYAKVDFTKIDIAFFSVQKGFGLPAGLGVLIVNNKALEKAMKISQKMSIGSYHNFLKLKEFETTYQTRETPNVLGIYLLGKVTEDMLNYGIENIRQETEKKAAMIYTFFETQTDFKPYVAEKDRSKTTIVIDVNNTSQEIVDKLEAKGFIVAKGYGKRKDLHIRIGNFPSHKISDLKKMLKLF